VRLRTISGNATFDPGVATSESAGHGTPKKSIAAGNYTITGAGGLFLTPSDASSNPGTTVIAARDPGNEKLWNLDPQADGAFKIVNANGGLVLGIRQDLKDAGTDAILWNWGGTAGQLWSITPLNGSLVKLVNKNSGLCLSVRASDGRTILQEKWNNLPTQRWKLVPAR
jgi:hypothetical protein